MYTNRRRLSNMFLGVDDEVIRGSLHEVSIQHRDHLRNFETKLGTILHQHGERCLSFHIEHKKEPLDQYSSKWQNTLNNFYGEIASCWSYYEKEITSAHDQLLDASVNKYREMLQFEREQYEKKIQTLREAEDSRRRNRRRTRRHTIQVDTTLHNVTSGNLTDKQTIGDSEKAMQEEDLTCEELHSPKLIDNLMEQESISTRGHSTSRRENQSSVRQNSTSKGKHSTSHNNTEHTVNKVNNQKQAVESRRIGFESKQTSAQPSANQQYGMEQLMQTKTNQPLIPSIEEFSHENEAVLKPVFQDQRELLNELRNRKNEVNILKKQNLELKNRVNELNKDMIKQCTKNSESLRTKLQQKNETIKNLSSVIASLEDQMKHNELKHNENNKHVNDLAIDLQQANLVAREQGYKLKWKNGMIHALIKVCKKTKLESNGRVVEKVETFSKQLQDFLNDIEEWRAKVREEQNTISQPVHSREELDLPLRLEEVKGKRLSTTMWDDLMEKHKVFLHSNKAAIRLHEPATKDSVDVIVETSPTIHYDTVEIQKPKQPLPVNRRERFEVAPLFTKPFGNDKRRYSACSSPYSKRSVGKLIRSSAAPNRSKTHLQHLWKFRSKEEVKLELLNQKRSGFPKVQGTRRFSAF